MKQVLPFFLFVALAIRVTGADAIPSELAGTWAPAGAKMQGTVLLNGYALYLNTNGQAVVAVAFEHVPTGTPWHAAYNITNRMLTLTSASLPGMSLSDRSTNHFTYDPNAKTLNITNSATKEADILNRHWRGIPRGTFEGFPESGQPTQNPPKP